MAREDVQTNLRLPADLKDRLQEAAAKSGRSLSSEVAFRLTGSFEIDRAAEMVMNNVKSVDDTLQEVRRLKNELDERIETAKKLLRKAD